MQDLDDVRAFLEVARNGSFGAAGRTLGTSKSMVSRRVVRLEKSLGAQLLSRTTRGVVVTEAGQTYTAHAERALAELESGKEAVRQEGGEVDGLLRIAAPLSFGTAHLAPVIAELALRHPRLRVHTSYSDRRVDLMAERFDVAIRLGSLPDSSLVARRIAPMYGAIVAAPSYLEARGTPQTLDELAKHDAIIQGSTAWRFLDGKREVNVPMQGRFDSDSGEATLAAAVAGLGVSLLPTFLAGEHIATGRLTVLLQAYRIPEFGLYVVRPPPATHMPRKIRALTELLVEKFGGEPYWDACYIHRKEAARKAAL
ncbi:LysR family transcriptional regulator [bacterium]|nr:MAG: LysR family transcriptional regulator [bacterium]